MARARNIKPGFFKNYELADLGPVAQLLFAGLWCLADRKGRLEDKPRFIKAEVFPYYDADVNGELTQLERLGFVKRYMVRGMPFISIVNFLKHQSPHSTEKASELPGEDEADTAEPLPVRTTKDNGDLTVGSRKDNGGNPPDSLIPDSLIHRLTDSLIPDSPIAEEPPLSISSPSAPKIDRDEVVEIFAYWQKRMNSPTSKLDDKRRKTIKKALAMKYSPADLCRAIRGCSLTPHNMGDSPSTNPTGQKYNGIELIFRNADQIDRFIANSSSPPRPSTADSPAQRREAESEANLRAFLGETQVQDPMTIEMEK